MSHSLTNMLTPQQKERIRARMQSINDGTQKQWLSPNNSEKFEESRALDEYQKVKSSGIIDRVMQKIKEVYGS